MKKVSLNSDSDVFENSSVLLKNYSFQTNVYVQRLISDEQNEVQINTRLN